MIVQHNSVRICTFNCNGLGNYSKRKDVFDYLRKQKYDIYLLQETHWKSKSENFIRSCWGYNCFVAGEDTNKKGVGILMNNTFEYKIHNVIKDPAGSYIILDMDISDERYTLVNVYGPSDGDRSEFFTDLFTLINTIDNLNIIVGGDWNVILNPKLDSRNYNCGENRPRSRKQIINIMNEHDMVDIWREIFPHKKRYTWRRFNSIQQSRLDYFLISNIMMSKINDIEITPGYRSDHSIVILGLKSKTAQNGDRPYWKFNNSLEGQNLH